MGSGLCGKVTTVGISLDGEVVGPGMGIAYDGPADGDVVGPAVVFADGRTTLDSSAVGKATGELENSKVGDTARVFEGPVVGNAVG